MVRFGSAGRGRRPALVKFKNCKGVKFTGRMVLTTPEGVDAVHVESCEDLELNVDHHTYGHDQGRILRYSAEQAEMIPAICCATNCRTVFPSGVRLSGSKSIKLGAGASLSCPECGSISRSVAGEFGQGAILLKALLANEQDIEPLKDILEILNVAVLNGDLRGAIDHIAHTRGTWLDLWGRVPKEDPMVMIHIIWIIVAVLGIAVTVGLALIDSSPEKEYFDLLADYHSKTIESATRGCEEAPQRKSKLPKKTPVAEAIEQDIYSLVPSIGFDNRMDF